MIEWLIPTLFFYGWLRLIGYLQRKAIADGYAVKASNGQLIYFSKPLSETQRLEIEQHMIEGGSFPTSTLGGSPPSGSTLFDGTSSDWSFSSSHWASTSDPSYSQLSGNAYNSGSSFDRW